MTSTAYERAALHVPADWTPALAPATSAPVSWVADGQARQAWWKGFGDPALDALLDRVLQRNISLAAAALTLRRAQLDARLVDTNLTPSVVSGASLSQSRALTTDAASVRTSATSTTASYELDLWGRLARLRDVAAFEAQATAYDRRATALTLVGTTARLYWRIAALNGLVATTRESILTLRETVNLLQVQQVAGTTNGIGEAQARSTLATLEADLTQWMAQREADRNALAILSDQAPSERELELARLPLGAMPPLPQVLPADMLGRRPDLMAAESRLRESLASADAARLAFYPTVSLTAALTTGGTALAELLKNPVGALGGALALPFVQWNTARLTSDTARATFDIAVVNFRQAFYQALADAQSAIAASRQSYDEVDRRRAALAATREAEALAEFRFRAGKTGAKEWLDLQQIRQNAALLLEQALYTQYNNEVSLFLALGGDRWAQTGP